MRALHIRDFAVIGELDLELRPGMTVLTGETGAGKSIIVDAVGLILGDRADTAMLRAGAERSEISATFSLSGNSAAGKLLASQDIDTSEDEIIVRRVHGNDGRTRAFVNGRPVQVQFLRDLGEILIDIHGQHAHQSLIRRDAQRALLDEYGGYKDILDETAAACSDWRALMAELEALGGDGQQRADRLKLLRYQVHELEAINPEPDEYAALEMEHTRLSHASRLLEGARQANERIAEADDALIMQIQRLERELKDLAKLDAALKPTQELLAEIGIQLSEAGSDLRRYLDRLELDPERLQQVENRLGALHDLARKHHVRPEALPAQLDALRRELATLEADDARRAQLGAAIEQALQRYLSAAARLHERRLVAGAELSAAVTRQIQALGLAGGEFRVEIVADDRTSPAPAGNDRVEFMVTTNPGQPLRPLAKVASGGELSRLSLAIQVIGSQDRGIPTLIFDEVDAGIGGAVAEIVGKLLKRLSARRQILCVTHLPQIASLAHQHLRVSKSTRSGQTYISVTELKGDQRIEEIARMLGGLKITPQTLAHAREMLSG